MNAYCASVCSDPAYQSALGHLGGIGFTTHDTATIDGQVYTHDDIAERFHEAYTRLRPQFTVESGSKRRFVKRNKRQFEKAVKSDVYQGFHISWWTVAFAALMVVLSGPIGLVIAVATCLFEYYFTKDLDGDMALMMAVGA